MSLQVSHLTKKYGDKTVLDDLNFQMDKPGVYALLGTNGAGKTTAIRMILGMLSRDGGDVLWNGKPLNTTTCNVGYLAEERGLYPKYSLMDQLMYFAKLRGIGVKEARSRIRYLAERLEVTEYIYPQELSSDSLGDSKILRGRKRSKPRLADQLSKGNQQKIQFICSLISDPELIVLDEPLSGLDPVNTDIFRSLIMEEINKGKYLIMSSHQMATVEEFCTDITILDRSHTILSGHLNEIKKSYGRVNLRLKTECDISRYIEKVGVQTVGVKEFDYTLKVTGDEQANNLLSMLIEDGITVIAFDLREPSLHEIFVRKVGEAHEKIQ